MEQGILNQILQRLGPMTGNVDVLPIALILQIDKAKGGKGLDRRNGRLLGAGDAGGLQVIKAIGQIVFQRAALRGRAPVKDQRMCFPEPFDLGIK